MNEVEKMYENAEPDRNCNLYKHFTECPMKHTQCEDCENFVYPPFTAEKQLELIKLIANRKGYPDYEYFGKLFDDYIQLREFDEALARLVNNLWQDLTEEERKQIRGILE